MMKVLSTKRLSESDLKYAAQLGFELTQEDFISIEPVEWDFETLRKVDCDSVAFTSVNSVKNFFNHPGTLDWIADKQVFSISGKTLETLEDLGVHVTGRTDDSTSLTEGVIHRGSTRGVLHVCGNITLDTLKEKLRNAGVVYHSLEVYRTYLITDRKLDVDFDGILFFSPSGVRGFFSANQLHINTVCCCIGNTTATALKQAEPLAKIVVSPFPSPKHMLDRLAQFLKTS